MTLRITRMTSLEYHQETIGHSMMPIRASSLHPKNLLRGKHVDYETNIGPSHTTKITNTRMVQLPATAAIEYVAACWVSEAGGFLSRGAFVREVFCPGDFFPGGLLPRGTFGRGDFCPGVFWPGVFCPGDFCPGGYARSPQVHATMPSIVATMPSIVA